MDLSVEVFDVSYGGRISIEDSTFTNVNLTRDPPKLVSTSMNDDLQCISPEDDYLKYNPEDDDEYDLESQPLDPNDLSQGLYVENSTLSDCLRPLPLCAPCTDPPV